MDGAIYLIYPKDRKNIMLYVGSTTNISRRIKRHEESCIYDNDKHYNYRLYTYIRANGGWDSFEMSIIEEVHNCDNLIELRKREQFHLDRIPLELRLNTRNAYTTKEQRNEQNRFYRKNNPHWEKDWKENNRDKINKQRRERRLKNRDEINRKDREARRQAKLLYNANV